MRGHWDGQALQITSSIEAYRGSREAGNKQWKTRRLLKGKNSEDHSGPVQFFYESHRLVGGREYLTRC